MLRATRNTRKIFSFRGMLVPYLNAAAVKSDARATLPANATVLNLAIGLWRRRGVR